MSTVGNKLAMWSSDWDAKKKQGSFFFHYWKQEPSTRKGNVCLQQNLLLLDSLHCNSHASCLLDCNIGVAKLTMAKQLAESVFGLEISLVSKVRLFPQRNRGVVSDIAPNNPPSCCLPPIWLRNSSSRRLLGCLCWLLQIFDYWSLLLPGMPMMMMMLRGMLVIMSYMLQLLLMLLCPILIIILVRKLVLILFLLHCWALCITASHTLMQQKRRSPLPPLSPQLLFAPKSSQEEWSLLDLSNQRNTISNRLLAFSNKILATKSSSTDEQEEEEEESPTSLVAPKSSEEILILKPPLTQHPRSAAAEEEEEEEYPTPAVALQKRNWKL